MSTKVDDIVRKISLWEQHGQSIMLAIITAALLFTARTLYESNAVQATMSAQISAMASQVARLEGAVSQMQMQYATRPELAELQGRVSRVEALAHPDRRN